MIALLANPPAPLALRVDLLAFRRPKRTQTFSELIWKLHQIIVNPASHAEEVKVAKRDMLRVIGKAKPSPQNAGLGSRFQFSSRINTENCNASRSTQQPAGGAVFQLQEVA
jgi:hypothetical protein